MLVNEDHSGLVSNSAILHELKMGSMITFLRLHLYFHAFDLGFCPYTENYGSERLRMLAYFMECQNK